MKIFSNKQDGYSLIELIVYLAIFSVIALVLIRSLMTSITTYSQAQAYRRLQNDGELVMERMVREIRQATTIDTTNSTFDNNNGVLALIGKDLNNNPETVNFSIINNNVVINLNGTSTILTSAQVVPVSLVFRNVSAGSHSAVKVELRLKTVSGYIVPASFYDTVILRGN